MDRFLLRRLNDGQFYSLFVVVGIRETGSVR
jgi:hypothetical protein